MVILCAVSGLVWVGVAFGWCGMLMGVAFGGCSIWLAWQVGGCGIWLAWQVGGCGMLVGVACRWASPPSPSPRCWWAISCSCPVPRISLSSTEQS